MENIAKYTKGKLKFNKEDDKQYSSVVEWENSAKYLIKVEALSVEPCKINDNTKNKLEVALKGRRWRYTCKVLVEVTVDNLDPNPGAD